MILRYNSVGKIPREVKIHFNKIQVVSWRFTYTAAREITHLYLSYINHQDFKSTLYAPVEQLLDKVALFEYLNTNFKEKCLEK